jgi:hypothetical protein
MDIPFLAIKNRLLDMVLQRAGGEMVLFEGKTETRWLAFKQNPSFIEIPNVFIGAACRPDPFIRQSVTSWNDNLTDLGTSFKPIDNTCKQLLVKLLSTLHDVPIALCVRNGEHTPHWTFHHFGCPQTGIGDGAMDVSARRDMNDPLVNRERSLLKNAFERYHQDWLLDDSIQQERQRSIFGGDSCVFHFKVSRREMGVHEKVSFQIGLVHMKKLDGGVFTMGVLLKKRDVRSLLKIMGQ